ncbi:hypothetical protein NBRC111894_1012 [Sporolactobacillus inulinus]|uniref:Uncharacterized protein n=1 Tax=Sporolactobacillus inulinus TaxID=2078 RepID=A0A4Y1Z9C6_9BACL|nr:hypothetical protein NBRC111894_1012 [Sporolactobacillus inulinus]
MRPSFINYMLDQHFSYSLAAGAPEASSNTHFSCRVSLAGVIPQRQSTCTCPVALYFLSV